MTTGTKTSRNRHSRESGNPRSLGWTHLSTGQYLWLNRRNTKAMTSSYRTRSAGFTLIELLIVIAIILILIAIALPNFLEARTRALVTKAKSEVRTLALALERYRLDWNIYPGRSLQTYTTTNRARGGLFKLLDPIE